MIDKSEIIADIRKIIGEFVGGGGNKISITLKSPKAADVFLNGEYFNTYDVENRKFMRNIRKKEENNGEFRICIEIKRNDLRERYEDYKGAQIQLPATESEIKDAYLRARITDKNQEYSMTLCEMYGTDISDQIQPDTQTVEKMNFLAKHMRGFDEQQHELFRGYMKQKGIENLNPTDLINISYNLDECEIYYDIGNDEELGKFYADNGMLDWLENAHENLWKYLNYEKIGQDIREAEGGIYTDEGYFFNGAEEFLTVYDGATFPEDFERDEYILKLHIGKKSSIEAGNTDDGLWLNLPASKEEKSRALDELCVSSFDECYLHTVQSMDVKIPQCISSISQLGALNSLTHRMRDMEHSGELAKFRAVLASIRHNDLDEIILSANSLNKYELYPELSSAVEYAKESVKREYGSMLPQSVIRNFNYESYAVDLCMQNDIRITEYGVLKCLESKENKIRENV